MHLAYIWIVSHLSAKIYQNRCKFDEVRTKKNLLSFFLDDGDIAAKTLRATVGTMLKMDRACIQFPLR